METSANRVAELEAALAEVRQVLDGARFPVGLPSQQPARLGAAALLRQLDDYLRPRLRQLSSVSAHGDAPVLAVVGGSTGAGKSTLVNSLVRAPASQAGVLRPTTRAPLLLAHPDDMASFSRRDRLPGLTRASRPGEQTLQIVSAPLLRPGLVLVDAPDLDSVVVANRALAQELLAAGDLWLFVTTAARYADAAPWRALREARDRGVAVAIVLDRVPPEAATPITAHLTGMLAAEGLVDTPLFTVHESTLDGHGMLPELAVAPIKRWLDTVAGDVRGRGQLSRRTLVGALAAVGPRMEELALAAEDQSAGTAALAAVVRSAYAHAMSDVESSVRSGAVLRGDVYARWRELVAGGELRLAVSGRPGALPAVLGRRFQAGVAAALAGLVTAADLEAAQACHRGLRAEPGGAAMLADDPTLGRPWAGFGDAAHDLVYQWQTTLRELAGGPAEALLATVAAVAPPAEAITGTARFAATLRSALRDPAARELGQRLREEFLIRVGELFSAEVSRHLMPILDGGTDASLAFRLRAAAGRLLLARTAVSPPPGRLVGRLEVGTPRVGAA